MSFLVKHHCIDLYEFGTDADNVVRRRVLLTSLRTGGHCRAKKASGDNQSGGETVTYTALHAGYGLFLRSLIVVRICSVSLALGSSCRYFSSWSAASLFLFALM